MRPAQLQLLDVFIVALSFDFPHGDILKNGQKRWGKKIVAFYHSFILHRYCKSADPYRKITVLPICGGLWLDFGEGLAQKILVENY
jgi:hypothetical protein